VHEGVYITEAQSYEEKIEGVAHNNASMIDAAVVRLDIPDFVNPETAPPPVSPRMERVYVYMRDRCEDDTSQQYCLSGCGVRGASYAIASSK
jgi:hypothetical protein